VKVVLAGGSGFIGKHLRKELESGGYEVVVLSRRGEVRWDAKTLGPWTEHLEGAAAVVNLAGKSISVRMTEANKKEIFESRRAATEVIGEAVQRAKVPPKVWLNANAMGYYGDRGDEILTEDSPSGSDYFAEVSRVWQAPLDKLDTPGTRKATLRIGFVLGKDGGGLPPLATLTKCFLGGRLGSGKQWLSWIHVDDVCRMFRWAIENEARGHYNAAAPNPATNETFMRALRKHLHRPWAPPAPAFALRLLGKVMAPDPSLALISTRLSPKRALQEGFRFRYPELDGALKDLL
jgi:uncharacterized protein (TIGR01777 family)